ncbi:MAG: WS/DGAT domain-containing protein, partial [Chloroflexota bacterium]
GLSGAAVQLSSQLGLAERAAPVVNLTITNVPGPQMPIYMAGHKLLGFMGAAPIGEGIALIISVFSYNGVLSISPLSTPEIMPDMDAFARYLREAANELEALILPEVDEEPEAAAGQSDALFDQLRAFVQTQDFFRLVLNAGEVPSDDLLAAAIRYAANFFDDPNERYDFLVACGRQIARLLTNDLKRLSHILNLIKPVV